MVMDDVERLRRHGQNLLLLRRFDEARSSALEALSQEPGEASTHRLLGEIELGAGRLDLAAQHATDAMGIAADPASLHLAARVARHAGRYDEAIELCSRALVMEPDLAPLHMTLSLATSGPWLDARPDGDGASDRTAASTRAMDAANTALALQPDQTGGYYAKAVAHVIADDLVGAASALEQGLSVQPDWPDGHVLMGVVRARQGMVKLASRHFATAGRLDPGDDRHIERLRAMRPSRRFLNRRRKRQVPWHLAPEARQIIAADDRLARFDP